MVYTLTNAFGSKIFNFNEFVNNLDVKAFLDDNFTFLCEYRGSPFVDKYRSHIITGNLKIISKVKLLKRFSKGPKYRENRTVDFEKAKGNRFTGIKK